MEKPNPIQLPKPSLKGNLSLEEAFSKRRSHRAFKKEPLTLKEVSQILFASQGVNNKKLGRTVPSAGALYPIDAYLVSGNVQEIPPGVYKYRAENHQLIKISPGDKRKELLSATFFQFWVEEAPATIILAATPWRTMIKYGWKGKAFVLIEIGHSAQNISLQAASLGLGTVCVGGFKKMIIKKILGLKGAETPLYIMPLGRISKNNEKRELEIGKRHKQAIKNFLYSK